MHDVDHWAKKSEARLVCEKDLSPLPHWKANGCMGEERERERERGGEREGERERVIKKQQYWQ